MTTPPISKKSPWASLWGGGRLAEKTAAELRIEHAERDAGNEPRNKGEPVDALGVAAPLHTEDEDADGNPVRHPEYTLRVAGYGGVTVRRANDATTAFLGILELCEENLRAWDAALTQYGVLVAKLDAQPAVAFYVRRSRDGMTLAVPDAQNRGQALMQVVQALLTLQVKHRAIFEAAGVQAFRVG